MSNTPAKKKWKKWVLILAAIYILGGIAIYSLQDRVMFQPERVDKKEAYHFPQSFREIDIPVNAGSTLNIVQFTPQDSLPRGVVLYLHGNKQNIARYAEYAPYFTKHGYEVWMIDYPGFGKSTGEFTEKNLYESTNQFYKLARSRFAPDQIIIYGKSLGTGLAAQLASVHNCRQLILETPYYDLPSLVKRFFFIYPVDRLIKYQIPTWQYLQKVDVPVTILHGTSDGVIPYSNALKLKDLLKPNGEFITIEGGSHNDLYRFPRTLAILDSLLGK